MGEVASEPTLAELFEELRKAKVFEGEAKALRLEAEKKIVATIKDHPEVGSMTLDAGVGKVTCKFGVNYKADIEQIRDVDLPEGVSVLKFKPASWELDKVAYEKLRGERPDLFAKVAAHVTTKPAKTGVTLKI